MLDSAAPARARARTVGRFFRHTMLLRCLVLGLGALVVGLLACGDDGPACEGRCGRGMLCNVRTGQCEQASGSICGNNAMEDLETTSCECDPGYDDCNGDLGVFNGNGCECNGICNGTSCEKGGPGACKKEVVDACGFDDYYCTSSNKCKKCRPGYYNCDGLKGCEKKRPCDAPPPCKDGTWRLHRTKTIASLRALWGTDFDDVYAAGFGNEIVHYSGGREWEPIRSDAFNNRGVYGLWGPGLWNVFAAGDDGMVLHFDGEIELDRDGQKAKWNRMKTGTSEPLTGIFGADAQDIYAVGARGVVIHYDGEKWEQVDWVEKDKNGNPKPPKEDRPELPYWKAVWVDEVAGEVHVVGELGTTLHFDGEVWKRKDQSGEQDLLAVWGRNRDEIYAVGAEGKAYRIGFKIRALKGKPIQRTISYSNWTINADKTEDLNAIWGTEAELFITTDEGAVLIYNGKKWRREHPGGGSLIGGYGLWGTSDKMFLAGGGGKIYEYTCDKPDLSDSRN